MSTLGKIILGFVAICVVVCLFSAVGGFLLLGYTRKALANGVQTDPAKADKVASTIADYTVPAGFGSAYAGQAVGFSLVGYTGTDNHSHIYLIQIPNYIRMNQAEIERLLRQNAPEGTYDRVTRMEVVDRRASTIRGQAVILVVSEGANHEGQAYREVSGMFDGKGGKTLVNVSAPLQSWDQAAVESFLASIE